MRMPLHRNSRRHSGHVAGMPRMVVVRWCCCRWCRSWVRRGGRSDRCARWRCCDGRRRCGRRSRVGLGTRGEEQSSCDCDRTRNHDGRSFRKVAGSVAFGPLRARNDPLERVAPLSQSSPVSARMTTMGVDPSWTGIARPQECPSPTNCVSLRDLAPASSPTDPASCPRRSFSMAAQHLRRRCSFESKELAIHVDQRARQSTFRRTRREPRSSTRNARHSTCHLRIRHAIPNALSSPRLCCAI